ncbi:hypothetical protein V8D89_012971 [Ganoderma adspersum]
MPALTIVKKALLVGVQYKASADHNLAELVSTHKDVARFTRLLTEVYGYNPKDITTLIDDDSVPHELWPMKANIGIMKRPRSLPKEWFERRLDGLPSESHALKVHHRATPKIPGNPHNFV